MEEKKDMKLWTVICATVVSCVMIISLADVYKINILYKSTEGIDTLPCCSCTCEVIK